MYNPCKYLHIKIYHGFLFGLILHYQGLPAQLGRSHPVANRTVPVKLWFGCSYIDRIIFFVSLAWVVCGGGIATQQKTLLSWHTL